LEGNHPEPFLTKRPTPPQEGNGGDYNLKGMLLFRGLLRRTNVLLAVIVASSRNDRLYRGFRGRAAVEEKYLYILTTI